MIVNNVCKLIPDVIVTGSFRTKKHASLIAVI